MANVARRPEMASRGRSGWLDGVNVDNRNVMNECVFCQIIRGELEQSEVYRGGGCRVLLDIYPWRPGHTLVMPERHVASVTELTDDERVQLFSVASRVTTAMRASALRCDDVHLILNDGPAANQTVPHVHVHLIPRWRGDLWKLAARLATHPFTRLFGQAPRAALDGHAADIRAALEL